MEEFISTFSLFWTNYNKAILAFAMWMLGGLVLDRIVVLLATQHKIYTPNWLRSFFIAVQGIFVWIGIVIGIFFAWDAIRVQLRPDADWSKYYRGFITIVITAFIARVLKRLIAEYSRKQGTRLPSSSIFSNITSALVWVIGLGIMLVSIGVQLTPIITAFGIGGVAIGLALQPTLDNLFSGIQILASEQILPSDFVRLSTGEEGFVEDVTWRNTTVRRFSGDIVIVPNSVLSKTHIVNYSRSDRPYSLAITITIPAWFEYEKALYEAKLIADKVAEESPLTYKATAPIARLQGISADGCVLKVYIPVLNYYDRDIVRSDFMTIVLERFKELEIPIFRIEQAP